MLLSCFFFTQVKCKYFRHLWNTRNHTLDTHRKRLTGPTLTPLTPLTPLSPLIILGPHQQRRPALWPPTLPPAGYLWLRACLCSCVRAPVPYQVSDLESGVSDAPSVSPRFTAAPLSRPANSRIHITASSS